MSCRVQTAGRWGLWGVVGLWLTAAAWGTATAQPPAAWSDAEALPEPVRAALAAAEADPSDVAAQLRLGQAYYEIGRLLPALRAYRQAVALDSQSVPAAVNMALMLRELGRSEPALEAFARARRLAPEDAELLAHEAATHYARGDIAKAVGGYLAVIAQDPQNQLARFQLGLAFAEAGILKEALREWQRVVAIDPATATALQAAENIRTAEAIVGPVPAPAERP